MTSTAVENLVRQIHDAGMQFVLAVTGGGSGAISSLFCVPGASRSMLLAAVPYSEAALVEWLGARPETCCSARTARAMAMAAYQRARALDPGNGKLAGVGCTASLASDRPKQGTHRFFIAMQTADRTVCISVELVKGLRSRADEESIVAFNILNEMAFLTGVNSQLKMAWLSDESARRVEYVAKPEWRELLSGETARVGINAAARAPKALLPGAFNPLHYGHTEMAAITAAKLLGHEVHFELSVTNVDKPPLDFLEIESRAEQFRNVGPLWLTRAPTFVEKAKLFPGVTFVVGIDTLVRIAEPRYYEHDERKLADAIRSIAACGCRFLVFGRVAAGEFRTLEELRLPAELIALCTQVPEAEFRQDVSSTELRRGNVDSV